MVKSGDKVYSAVKREVRQWAMAEIRPCLDPKGLLPYPLSLTKEAFTPTE
jgi:hypothetical protein